MTFNGINFLKKVLAFVETKGRVEGEPLKNHMTPAIRITYAAPITARLDRTSPALLVAEQLPPPPAFIVLPASEEKRFKRGTLTARQLAKRAMLARYKTDRRNGLSRATSKANAIESGRRKRFSLALANFTACPAAICG